MTPRAVTDSVGQYRPVISSEAQALISFWVGVPELLCLRPSFAKHSDKLSWIQTRHSLPASHGAALPVLDLAVTELGALKLVRNTLLIANIRHD